MRSAEAGSREREERRNKVFYLGFGQLCDFVFICGPCFLEKG